jgi:hypothetical protein
MERKSPTIHASENPVGKIKIGNDQHNWIILEKNKIKKWYLLGKYKKYYTEDNGNAKYKVIIGEKNIYVFFGPDYTNLVYQIKNLKNIFIGKNTKKYSIYDKLYTGSSILIEIKKNDYIFIGTKIMNFKTVEPIIEFHSIMGNSSVVYPFALTKSYAYVILENVYLERNFGDKDPYEIFYNNKLKKQVAKYKVTILHN